MRPSRRTAFALSPDLSARSLRACSPPVAGLASDLSRRALLMGIVAVGMKTSLKRMLDVGGDAIAVIVAETLFVPAFILLGLHFLTGVR